MALVHSLANVIERDFASVVEKDNRSGQRLELVRETYDTIQHTNETNPEHEFLKKRKN